MSAYSHLVQRIHILTKVTHFEEALNGFYWLEKNNLTSSKLFDNGLDICYRFGGRLMTGMTKGQNFGADKNGRWQKWHHENMPI